MMSKRKEDLFMSKAYITHLPHFLDEKGLLPRDIPAPARSLALAIGRIIAYATFNDEDIEMPGCLHTIRRKRCEGKVMTGISLQDNDIEWHCTSCGTYGVVSGWQGSLWDLSERKKLH
jgi:hypothetical protein